MAASRKAPCSECPFRRDTEPGQFPRERYEALEETVGAPGEEVAWDKPMFACHKSAEGKEIACAGWMAVCGYDHLLVRILLGTGQMNPEALTPDEGWPELFESYDEMAAAQGNDYGCEIERNPT